MHDDIHTAQQTNALNSPKVSHLNLKIHSNFFKKKKTSSKPPTSGLIERNTNPCNETYLLGENNHGADLSMNLSNLNLTNEYCSLSPANNTHSNLANSSLLVGLGPSTMKNNDL